MVTLKRRCLAAFRRAFRRIIRMGSYENTKRKLVNYLLRYQKKVILRIRTERTALSGYFYPQKKCGCDKEEYFLILGSEPFRVILIRQGLIVFYSGMIPNEDLFK
jgi:hypothetical protein